MVKIIRCASTNETISDFTSYFNEQIQIKANSKIALESLSLDLNELELVQIPAQFNWQVQNATQDEQRLCTIQTGTYTSKELIAKLQLTLNTTCNWRTDPSGINTEYKPFFDEENKLNIQWLTNIQDSGSSLLTKSYYEENTFTTVLGPITEDDTITYTNEVPDTVNTCIVTTEMASLNSGGIKCRLLGNTTAGNVVNGFSFGLKKTTSSNTNNILPDDLDVLCCIFVDATGLIQVWQNGVRMETLANINAQSGAGDNNYTDIWVYKSGVEGKLQVYIQRADALQPVPLVKLADQIAPEGAYNWGYAGFNAVNTSITKFSYLPSPYLNSNATGISIIEFNSQKQDLENYIQYDELGAPNQLPTSHTLTFPDIVKKKFGFKLNSYTQEALSGNFKAELTVVELNYETDIFVEIPSLGLECFDSTIGGRRNIIKFIPNDKANISNKKEYVSQFPVYVNIRNAVDTYINSIQVRFLNPSYQPLITTGLANACEAILIIED